MTPAGNAAFTKREINKSKIYSYEQKKIKFDKHFEQIFKAKTQAWKYFRTRPLSYQRTSTWWVMSAKQWQTRLRRLQELIKDSDARQYIKSLRRPARKT